jgi:hypothetical protein
VAMKLLSGYLDDAYMTWLSSSVNCCGPLKEQAPMRGENSTVSVPACSKISNNCRH